MQGTITKSLISQKKRLSESTNTPIVLWDTEIRGFGCRISPSGRVSWLLQVWSGGKRFADGGKAKRVTFEATDLDDARSKAMQLKAKADVTGVDPVSAKQERRAKQREALAATKLKDAWEDYEKDHPWKSESHKSHTRSYFENDIIPVLKGNTAIRDITQDDIASLIKSKKRKHPIAARYLFRVLSPFFKYCIVERYISSSPMDGLQPPPASESRDRVLTEAEIVSFWKATTGWDTKDVKRDRLNSIFNPFHRLLLLTGQRRDEVSWMEWNELDLDNNIWVIPPERTKNHKPHLVPLSPQALAILRSLPRMKDGDGKESKYLFTTVFLSAISGYGRPKERLDKAMQAELGELPHWTLHDLRRTFVTISNDKGFADPHVIEAAVNHLTGLAKRGVAGTYNRAAYLVERRQLFNRWGEYIENLVSPKAEAATAANVISLQTRIG